MQHIFVFKIKLRNLRNGNDLRAFLYTFGSISFQVSGSLRQTVFHRSLLVDF